MAPAALIGLLQDTCACSSPRGRGSSDNATVNHFKAPDPFSSADSQVLQSHKASRAPPVLAIAALSSQPLYRALVAYAARLDFGHDRCPVCEAVYSWARSDVPTLRLLAIQVFITAPLPAGFVCLQAVNGPISLRALLQFAVRRLLIHGKRRVFCATPRCCQQYITSTVA